MDWAIYLLGYDWVPVKGFHYVQGPYVQYSGTFDDIDKGKLMKDIEDKCNELIEKGVEVKAIFVERDKVGEVSNFPLKNIPEGKPVRVVLMEDFGIPCGGIHVDNIKEIGPMKIRKIKFESGNVRVAYTLTDL
jgi:Ser-tRNA(Ala) deacylase AlaX